MQPFKWTQDFVGTRQAVCVFETDLSWGVPPFIEELFVILVSASCLYTAAGYFDLWPTSSESWTRFGHSDEARQRIQNCELVFRVGVR